MIGYPKKRSGHFPCTPTKKVSSGNVLLHGMVRAPPAYPKINAAHTIKKICDVEICDAGT